MKDYNSIFTKMDTNSLEGMKVDYKNKFNSNLMGVIPGKKPKKKMDLNDSDPNKRNG